MKSYAGYKVKYSKVQSEISLWTFICSILTSVYFHKADNYITMSMPQTYNPSSRPTHLYSNKVIQSSQVPKRFEWINQVTSLTPERLLAKLFWAKFHSVFTSPLAGRLPLLCDEGQKTLVAKHFLAMINTQRWVDTADLYNNRDLTNPHCQTSLYISVKVPRQIDLLRENGSIVGNTLPKPSMHFK